MWKKKLKKIVRKLVHGWNGHLEIFSRPQVTENSRQHPEHLLLRTDILQSLGAPDTLGSFSNNDRNGDTKTSFNKCISCANSNTTTPT